MAWTIVTPRVCASALLIGALSGCGYLYGGAVATEKDRLVAAGYRLAAGSEGDGSRYVLEYSGAPTGDVVCRPAAGGAFAALPETALIAGGEVRYRSDVRVTLVRPGPFSFEPAQRDAFHVLTAVSTRAGAPRPDSIETISFSRGEEAAFQSGMTCRAG